MKKRLLNYIDKMNALIQSDGPDTEWDKTLFEHLNQIRFFQHERLVHLIVTIAFGLFLALIAILLFLTDDYFTFAGVFLLFSVVAVTLVFYTFPYFFLENHVQKLYDQYDELQRKVNIK